MDFSVLSSSQLSIFKDLVQTKELVNSVLSTADNNYINQYLSNISIIRKKDEMEIYALIGNYNRNVFVLEKKTIKNLLKITNNIDCKKMLDRRRKNIK